MLSLAIWQKVGYARLRYAVIAKKSAQLSYVVYQGLARDTPSGLILIHSVSSILLGNGSVATYRTPSSYGSSIFH